MKNKKIKEEIEVYSDYCLTIRSLINKLVNVLEMNDIDDARVETSVIMGYHGDIEEVNLKFFPIVIPKCNETGH